MPYQPDDLDQRLVLFAVEELVKVYVALVYTLIARITKALRVNLDGEIEGLGEHLGGVVTED